MLVGVGLEMGAVGVQYLAADQSLRDGLLDHGLEDLLMYRTVGEPAAPVLTDRRGVGYLVGQSQPQKPAIGDVDLDLAHQLAFAANAEQLADEQRLEQQYRIECGPAVIGAVEMTHPVANEGEVERGIDLAQEVVVGNQLLERDHLEFMLLWGRIFEHVGSCSENGSANNNKAPAKTPELCQQSEAPRPGRLRLATKPALGRALVRCGNCITNDISDCR